MIKAFALGAMLCGLIFVYGFLVTERVKVTHRTDERKNFYVMVTVPNVTDARWVEVFICAAEITESGVFCLGDGWEAISKKETHPEPVYEFPFGRYVPRGTLRISAVLADVNWKTLASGQTVVMR